MSTYAAILVLKIMIFIYIFCYRKILFGKFLPSWTVNSMRAETRGLFCSTSEPGSDLERDRHSIELLNE